MAFGFGFYNFSVQVKEFGEQRRVGIIIRIGKFLRGVSMLFPIN
jgi:hypothetical protein